MRGDRLVQWEEPDLGFVLLAVLTIKRLETFLPTLECGVTQRVPQHRFNDSDRTQTAKMGWRWEFVKPRVINVGRGFVAGWVGGIG